MNDKKGSGGWFYIIAIGLVLGLVNVLPKVFLTDEYKREHGIGEYHKEQSESPNSTTIERENRPESGLYASFIAPEEDELESFVEQLDSAILRLPATEQEKITNAIGFLSFSLAAYLEEADPENFQNLTESDIAAKTYVRLYRTARENGDEMSLSKYVELADEFKKVRPDHWEQYKSLIEAQ